MNTLQTVQFFLKNERTDSQITSALGSTLKLVVETPDHQMPGAVGAVLLDLHDEGFRQSCLVSWPKKRSPQLSEEDMAKSIATALDVDVLLEMDDDEWLLAQPGKEPRIVEVIELEDGLDVKPD